MMSRRGARMLEYFGPIQRLALAPLIWIVLFPALGASTVLYFLGRALLLRDPPSPLPPSRTLARVAAASVALALLAVVYQTVLLAKQPSESRELYSPLLRIVRVGQLDLRLALRFDSLTALFALVVTLIATVWLAREALAVKPDVTPRSLAAACALVAGTLLLLMADGFATFLVGSQLASVSALVLLGPPRRGRFVLERLGELSIVVGAAALFWALGGTWSDAEYVPDLNPRYVAVSSLGTPDGHVPTSELTSTLDHDDDKPPVAHVIGSVMGKGATPSTTGRGYLTLASTPGALVYQNDSHTPMTEGGQPLVAPFVRHPVSGGVHTFRVHPGGGSDDYLVTHAPMGGDGELSLVLVGGTMEFREIADQMVLENARGERFLREALHARHLFGISLPVLFSLLFACGALARAGLAVPGLPSPEAPRFALPLVTSLGGALPGVYLLVRLAPVLGFGFSGGVIVTALASVVALGVAAATRAARGRAAIAAATANAVGAMAIVAALGGAPTIAVGLSLIAALGASVHALVPEASVSPAARARVAAALSFSLLAALVVAPARLAGLDAVGFPRLVPAVLLAIAAGLLSGTLVLALRAGASNGAAQGGASPRKGSGDGHGKRTKAAAKKGRGQDKSPVAHMAETLPSNAAVPAHAPTTLLGVALLGVAAVALALAIVVGALVHDAAWLRLGLAPSLRAASLPAFSSSASAYGAGALSLALMVFAGAFAKPAGDRASVASRLLGEPLLERLSAWTERVAQVAIEIDERVLDGILDAGGLLTRAAAWAEARFDVGVVDAPARAATEGLLDVGARPLHAAGQGRGEHILLLAIVALPVVGIALYLISSR